MQNTEQLATRKPGGRLAGAIPLALLQQNVLLHHIEALQKASSRSTSTGQEAWVRCESAKLQTARTDWPGGTDHLKLAEGSHGRHSFCTAREEVTYAQTEPVQQLLQALKLTQYCAVFIKEEIDEEALQCLSNQDLIAMGVADRSHRQKLLSAAVQLAKPSAAHLASATLSRPVSDLRSASHLKPASQPRLASAVPAQDLHATSAAAAPATSGWHATAAAPQLCQASQGDTGAATSSAPRASASSAITGPNKSRKMSALQCAGASLRASSPQGALSNLQQQQVFQQHMTQQHVTQQHVAQQDGTQQHVTAQHVAQQHVTQKQSSSRRDQPPGSKANLAGHKGILPVPPSCKGAVPTRRRTAGSSKQSHTSRSKAKPAAIGSAVAGGSVNKAAAVAGSNTAHMPKQAGDGGGEVLAPTSRADEEHHLALALSASLAKPGSETPVMLLNASSKVKPKAVEGVFSTMMTASRQTSKSAAASCSSTPLADAEETFSRASEEALLNRSFTHVVTTALLCGHSPKSKAVMASSWSSVATAMATAADHAQSLWKRASQQSPPACTLQQRVQKRKVQQAIVMEQARQSSIAQQCAAAEALLGPCEDADESQAQHQTSSGSQHCTGLRQQSACINLTTSPEESARTGGVNVNSQKRGVACTGLQHSQDPMKRVRLLALRQELKAAKQTVADLERMIVEVEQG